MTGAKTAFLILAHTAPDHVARLTAALRAPWARSFVHIDRGADRAPFDALLADDPSVLVLADDERVAVNWGGFSIIDATLRLIRKARAEMPDAQRFCLLSGADYPVQPMSVIGHAMASDVEYMKIDRRLEWGGPQSHDANITHPFFGDFPPANPRTGQPIVAKIVDRLSSAIKRTPPSGVAFYHGSCWWALTGGAVDAIVRQLDERPALAVWFRRVKVPDEIMFQSLIKATPFADRLSQDGAANPSGTWPDNLHGSHYIRWTEPNPVLPRTLLADDLEGIRASGALFARKIDSDRSADLLAAIDDIRQSR